MLLMVQKSQGQPPGMYKSLYMMGEPTYQLAQGFFHREYYTSHSLFLFGYHLKKKHLIWFVDSTISRANAMYEMFFCNLHIRLWHFLLEMNPIWFILFQRVETTNYLYHLERISGTTPM